MRRPVALLAFLCCSALVVADDWPAWRGPTGLGVSAEKNLPLEWDKTKNAKWKVALPAPGNSTPVIWGDRVFITQASDLKQWPPEVPANYAGGAWAGGHAIAEKRSVMCFSWKDGKLLWQSDTVYTEPEITHPTNPFCSASPVTDGERVIASHGSAGLVCYDFEGKHLWHYDVGKLEHLWGNASSPILHGDLCIAWCGPGERQFLLAVNKMTGKKVWETPIGGGDPGITTKNFLGSWATPCIARVGEQDRHHNRNRSGLFAANRTDRAAMSSPVFSQMSRHLSSRSSNASDSPSSSNVNAFERAFVVLGTSPSNKILPISSKAFADFFAPISRSARTKTSGRSLLPPSKTPGKLLPLMSISA